MNRNSLKNYLQSLGYSVREYSNYLTCNAKYRDGQDDGSVVIYDNLVKDYVTGHSFNYKQFVQLVSGLNSSDDIQKIISENKIDYVTPEVKIKQIKVFPNAIVKELYPMYDYWLNRQISIETLRATRGGVFSGKGVMKNRFVFPIFNSKEQIIALNGRDITNNPNRPKWIFNGTKACVYPAFINSKLIRESGVAILLESIGDWLALSTCGINNGLVMFGVDLNLAIINYFLKNNMKKIIISPNNDSLTNNAGNNASDKIYNKLRRYFDSHIIEKKLPDKEKDWNDVLIKHGKEEILKQLPQSH